MEPPQAHKEQEDAVLIQTNALKLDNNIKDHESSPNQQQQKEGTTTMGWFCGFWSLGFGFLICTLTRCCRVLISLVFGSSFFSLIYINICNSKKRKNNNNNFPLWLHEVEAILEYEFKNKHLLEEALTHITYDADQNYERLEYIGDVVLNFLITKEQFLSHPNMKAGDLTDLRKANVNNEKLARVAIKHGLHCYLRHKKPQLVEQIEEFTKAIVEYPLHSNGLMYVPKCLADIVESTIGAVFIDCGSSVEIPWKVFRKLLEPIIDSNTAQKHPFIELKEVCQKKKLNLQFVDLWEETTNIDVFINDTFVGRGTYGSKKDIARYRAAKNALDNIDKVLSLSTSTIEDALVN